MSDDKAARTASVAALLIEARRSGETIEPPVGLEPRDGAEAWEIHRSVVTAEGPIAAWKVGASGPAATPAFGAISAATLFEGPAKFARDAFGLGAVEAEIAVRMARDLPARDEPYTSEEVLAAIGSWHAAIEVLETAFARWPDVSAAWKLADRQSHGALVLGAGRPDRPATALERLPVRLLVDGEPVFAHEGGNVAGDPIRLVVHLANALRGTDRPLKAGDAVTTGSATPFLRAAAGQTVRVEFEHFDPVELTIEP